MFDSTEYSSKMRSKTVLSNMRNLESFHWLKNSDFILESKQKFKTNRSTRCSVKTLFYINKLIAQFKKLFTHLRQNPCS